MLKRFKILIDKKIEKLNMLSKCVIIGFTSVSLVLAGYAIGVGSNKNKEAVYSDISGYKIPFWIDEKSIPEGWNKDEIRTILIKASKNWQDCGANFIYMGAISQNKLNWESNSAISFYGNIDSYFKEHNGAAAVTVTGNGKNNIPESFGINIEPGRITFLKKIVLDSNQFHQDGYVIASNVIDYQLLESVVTHELGHVLGLKHLDSGIMGKAVGANDIVKEKDIEMCKNSLLNWKKESVKNPIKKIK